MTNVRKIQGISKPDTLKKTKGGFIHHRVTRNSTEFSLFAEEKMMIDRSNYKNSVLPCETLCYSMVNYNSSFQIFQQSIPVLNRIPAIITSQNQRFAIIFIVLQLLSE